MNGKVHAEPAGDLFPADAVAGDSPRLRWLAKHGLVTRDNGASGEDELGEYKRWVAWRPSAENGGEPRSYPRNWVGYGDTEDEALADWSRKHRHRTWLEEGL